MTRYIFVVGGVMSGVGKGIASASIGTILQSKGFHVSALKIDPYINVDAGTMNPVEHGETFVTEDGMECDQDLGTYERFLNQRVYAFNYMTTGGVYQAVINRERNLEYNGRCVEVVPDIPNEVISRIKKAAQKTKAEIMIVEIGGTVGEYQNMLFLEAGRMMRLENPKKVIFVMVSYLPIPKKIGEMKTKPTQYAVRTLNSAGIEPDFILARSARPLDSFRKKKISIFCNIKGEAIISAPDVNFVYEVPLNFEKDHLGEMILKKFGLRTRKKDLKNWRKQVKTYLSTKKKIKIALVGKYFQSGDFTFADSYISVIEAVKHGAISNFCQPEFHWFNAEDLEMKGARILEGMNGVIVPQGWGKRGNEGMIKAIKFCREKKKPFLGLCYGMQMAVIEFARNVCKLKKSNSEEIDKKTPHPVIHLMPDQEKYLREKQYGGTIRLGAWPCLLKKDSLLYKIYKKEKISERHRHRYEFNNQYRELMEKNGMIFSGTSPDGKLVEAIEIKNHPFFVGTQFHPEYQSSFLFAHPLFKEFVKTCLAHKSHH